MLNFITEKMDHQKAAYNKLSKIKVGACLAEMGTGKTRVTLELAIDRIKANKVDCILWLCPVSVKKTIEEEINKHIDKCSYELVDSSKINNMQSYIFITGIESMSQSDRNYQKILKIVENKNPFIVLDESSLIKNWGAKRTKRIIKLSEYANYKLILNGTPVTNTEQDLFSQWYFLDNRILGYQSFWSFAANHLEYDEHIPGRIVRVLNVDYLTRKIAPYTYQVTKDECLDLPGKTYSNYYFNMTYEQKEIYYWTKENVLNQPLDDIWDCSWLFELLSKLQKVIAGIHPEGMKSIFKNPLNNPRIKLLLEIISELPDDKKVIIWCKYQYEIETIKKVLGNKYGKGNISELWGGINGNKRDNQLEKFKNGSKFLIANKKCGAFGLNLQFCNYAIYYSNDYSWATRKQSEDRQHRAGQQNNVHIMDIICNNSIDEMIQDSLASKESLVDNFKKKIDKVKDESEVEEIIKKL
jgi:SNF2 family DNA or RNA helicase